MRQKTLFYILLILAIVVGTDGFVSSGRPSTLLVSTSSLGVGPLQKISNKQEYNKVVEGLMFTRGISRQEAEREYDSYLDNPNNYALQKVFNICGHGQRGLCESTFSIFLTDGNFAFDSSSYFLTICRERIITNRWGIKV
jgi:hypothetical protein